MYPKKDNISRILSLALVFRSRELLLILAFKPCRIFFLTLNIYIYIICRGCQIIIAEIHGKALSNR